MNDFENEFDENESSDVLDTADALDDFVELHRSHDDGC